jgi:hypothetical protein
LLGPGCCSLCCCRCSVVTRASTPRRPRCHPAAATLPTTVLCCCSQSCVSGAWLSHCGAVTSTSRSPTPCPAVVVVPLPWSFACPLAWLARGPSGRASYSACACVAPVASAASCQDADKPSLDLPFPLFLCHHGRRTSIIMVAGWSHHRLIHRSTDSAFKPLSRLSSPLLDPRRDKLQFWSGSPLGR